MAGDQRLLKRINRMALVRLVKSQSGLSRADLAKRTGLTKSTVSVLVHELIDEGWLCESEVGVAQGLGRRPTPLTIDPARLALLGAELGVDDLNVVACGLDGASFWSRREACRHVGIEGSVRTLCGAIAEARANALARGCQVLGVGVAVPGVIDARDGALRFAPNIGWHDVAIRELLCRELEAVGCGELPLEVLNDANAAALGVHIFGADHRAGPLVYVSMGIGLGAGIVLGDRLYLGYDGLAGEIGHTILNPEGPLCACGRRGCAENYVSQRAVSRSITGAEEPILAIGELVDRLARKEPGVVEAVGRAGEYLGVLMQNLCNTVNPAVIVLGGPLAELGEPLVQAGVASMRTRGGRYDHHRVEIQRCPFGLNACAIGAASSIFHDFLRPLDAA